MTHTEIPQARLEEIREASLNTVGRILKPADAERVEIAAIVTELLDRRARSSLMDVAVEALRHIASALSYPVATEIDPRGWSLQTPNADRNGFAAEAARTALQAISASRNTGGDDV